MNSQIPILDATASAPACVYGIPVILKIPLPRTLCPILKKGRKHFYAQISRGIYLPLKQPGSLKGSGEVFGPSVCNAKLGCVCALKLQLEALRLRAKQGQA